MNLRLHFCQSSVCLTNAQNWNMKIQVCDLALNFAVLTLEDVHLISLETMITRGNGL
jgi:hypothetical protein